MFINSLVQKNYCTRCTHILPANATVPTFCLPETPNFKFSNRHLVLTYAPVETIPISRLDTRSDILKGPASC
jgi:hypothetical protein